MIEVVNPKLRSLTEDALQVLKGAPVAKRLPINALREGSETVGLLGLRLNPTRERLRLS